MRPWLLLWNFPAFIYLTYSKTIAMQKKTLLLPVVFFLFSFGINTGYTFSITRPANPERGLSSIMASEFIKLTFKQYASLTGKKENLWNKISFNVMRMQVRHDLSKTGDLKLIDYADNKHMGTVLKVFIWTAGIVLFLLLLLIIIYGKTKR